MKNVFISHKYNVLEDLIYPTLNLFRNIEAIATTIHKGVMLKCGYSPCCINSTCIRDDSGQGLLN